MVSSPVLLSGVGTTTSPLIARSSLEDMQARRGRFDDVEQYALQSKADDFKDYPATYPTYRQDIPVPGSLGPGMSGGDYALGATSVVSSRRYDIRHIPSRSGSLGPVSGAHIGERLSTSISSMNVSHSYYFTYGSSAPSISSSVSDRTQTAECVACGETVALRSSFEAPCAHHYCETCLEQFLAASTTTETSFPPWCCDPEKKIDVYTLITTDGHALPKLTTGALISEDLSQRIHAKAREYAVPYKNRVFCANPRCSVFLGSKMTLGKATSPRTAECQICSTAVCLECKQAAHLTGQKCRGNPAEGFDDASMAVRALAKEKEWQTCCGCYEMVEKSEGCIHVTCRCSTQFCYRCGVPWSDEHECPRPPPTLT
ncbi:hypothetical protein PQX77_015647 [Marasmius sp. AFHP31]|nr:hypothetical protein PQX77_015647 [Marasmius sp. AFHP31]